MKDFENAFANFKRLVESRKFEDAAREAQFILSEIRGAEDKDEFNQSYIQQLFDIAFRNSYLGCAKTFLSSGDLKDIPYVLSVIRKMAYTWNEAIVTEMFDCGIAVEIFALIYKADGTAKFDDAVYAGFTTLSNIFSDTDSVIRKLVDSPEIAKIIQKGLFLRTREGPRDGFIQFLSALSSTDYEKLREYLTSEVIDLIMDSLRDRSPERVDHILDGVAVIQFLTDYKSHDDEKPFAGIINYLIDKGFYQIAFDALSDEQLQPNLSTICARAIGNSLTLDNYPDIDRVDLANKKIISTPGCLNTLAVVLTKNRVPSLSAEVAWVLTNIAGSDVDLIGMQLSQNQDLIQFIMETLMDDMNDKVGRSQPANI